MSIASLAWSLLFGTFGMAYFVYGKKQGAFIPLFTGLALMAFPYFVGNTILMVIIGLALCILPFVWRQ